MSDQKRLSTRTSCWIGVARTQKSVATCPAACERKRSTRPAFLCGREAFGRSRTLPPPSCVSAKESADHCAGLDLASGLPDFDYDEDSPIVQAALQLKLKKPQLRALQILDQTIGQNRGDLDYEFDAEELEPPHPFAELLRQAFAPDLDPEELLAGLEASSDNAVKRAWKAAIMHFAARYEIWKSNE